MLSSRVESIDFCKQILLTWWPYCFLCPHWPIVCSCSSRYILHLVRTSLFHFERVWNPPMVPKSQVTAGCEEKSEYPKLISISSKVQTCMWLLLHHSQARKPQKWLLAYAGSFTDITQNPFLPKILLSKSSFLTHKRLSSPKHILATF